MGAILARVGLVFAAVVVIESIDFATGGEVYLASLSQFTQATELAPPPPVAREPIAPSPVGEVPPPPTRPGIPMDGQGGSPGVLQMPAGGDTKYAPSSDGRIPPPVGGEFQKTSGDNRFAPSPAIQPLPPNEKQPQLPRQFDGQQGPFDPIPRNQFFDQKPEQEFHGEPEGEEWSKPAVDPRQVKEVTRRLKDMQSQVKRLKVQARKVTALTDKINNIASRISELLGQLQGDDEKKAEVVEEVNTGELQDELNEAGDAARVYTEGPRTVTEFTRSLKQLDAAKNKAAAKRVLVAAGMSVEEINQAVGEMKEALNRLREALASQNTQAAREALDDLRGPDTLQPWAVLNFILGLQEASKLQKRSPDVQNAIPVAVEAAREGDYQEASNVLRAAIDSTHRRNSPPTKLPVR